MDNRERHERRRQLHIERRTEVLGIMSVFAVGAVGACRAVFADFEPRTWFIVGGLAITLMLGFLYFDRRLNKIDKELIALSLEKPPYDHS